MLPKKNRLGAKEVRDVLKNGRVLRTPTITVKYIEARLGKVAVVVSKKVARSAVSRNTIRRAVYRALPRPLPTKTQAVFLVQKNISDYTSDIKTICSKLFS